MTRLSALLIACVACASSWGLSAHAEGGADLSLSPKRVVLGPADRAATIYVFNRGTAAATYTLALEDEVMTADGQIRSRAEMASDPAGAQALSRLKSAEPFLTFAPHRVTLQPGESQTVRLRALRPGDLAPGEYRTHLTVTALPPEDMGLTAEQAANPTEGQLSVKVVTLFSISMPLIVRQGAVDVTASIDGMRLETRESRDPAAPAPITSVLFDLGRQGTSSLYGDVEVSVMKNGKPGEVIGRARGIGVYAEADKRIVAVPLSRAPASGQKLQILFRDDDTRPGVVLATAVFTAP